VIVSGSGFERNGHSWRFADGELKERTMPRLRALSVLAMVPFLAVLALLPGCEGTSFVDRGKPRPTSSGGDDGDVPKVAVVAKKFGTITGKVLYDGTPPKQEPQAMGPSEAQCHSAPKPADEVEFAWEVDPKTSGVLNAVVYLQPPAGKYFELPEEAKKPRKGTEVVKLRQPRCQFIPRVFVLYPSYFDQATNGLMPTGQQFEIMNDASFGHNWTLLPGSDDNIARGDTIKPGQVEIMKPLNPQSKCVTFQCNIHSWMRAYGFVLEHPYAAVTKADGTFTIENVPLGVELQVVGWHEAAGFFHGGEEGTKTTLSDNQELKLPKLKARGGS
jgi:hypothetical protein